MKVIHEYKIPLRNAVNRIYMREAAEIIKVGNQCDGNIMMWAIIDCDAKVGIRRIAVIGTGQHEYIGEIVPTKGQHIGSVIECDDEVYHVFDLGEE